MPKLKLGAAVYAVSALAGVVTVVQIVLRAGDWKGIHGWYAAVVLVLVALMTVLLGIGAVTRRGLISDEGPWIVQHGWTVLIGLTAAVFVASLVSNQGESWFPLGPVVFLPHFVRKYQEDYLRGRASAGERPATAESAD